VVPNEKGRVIDTEKGDAVTGIYVSGWIKRGPSGIIGTNKPDAAETVTCMLEDLEAGAVLSPANADGDSALQMVERAQPDFVSWAEWKRLQEIEDKKGQEEGRPRAKLTSVEDMLAALGRA
jgi:ferredoxin--NADP+ reductase